MGFTAVIDYGAGNLMSVQNALGYLGINSEITGDPRRIALADALVLPGVGAFYDAARRLSQSGLDRVLREQVEKKPLLGICLGMQLLFEGSGEGMPCPGLGLIKGRVEKIDTPFKLPHIGWNALEIVSACALTKGLSGGEYVYFVHSFSAQRVQPDAVCAVTDYGGPVCALTAKGNVFGCQFHPEKSGTVGLEILKNFGELVKC